jgi:type VI secretion system protein VasG
VQKRLSETQDIPLTYDESVVDLIASRCTEIESGGRMVDAILTQTMLPDISREFLTRLMNGTPAERVHIGVTDSNFVYNFS